MTWHHTLRQSGLRATPQRQLVLEAIEDLEHATPAQITNQVQMTFPTTNLSTVYRTLESLEDAGLVTHAVLTEAAPMYFLHTHDMHLVCEVCRSIACVDPSSVGSMPRQVKAAHGFTVDPGYLVLRGACAACDRASTLTAGMTPGWERLSA